MTLIKCPKCGQTVLSVASTCPKCHYLLTQNPLQQGAQGDLIECRRCQKGIPKTTVTCEYCGYPVQFRRRLRAAGWSGLGVVALALAAVVAVQIQAEDDLQEPRPVELPMAPPAAPAALPDRAPEPRDTTPRGLATAPRLPPTRPSTGAATPDTLRPPPGATPRWVTVWGNVRGSRDTLSPVIRTVAPGTPVLAARPQGGWFAVYVDSVFIGFMAGDLLSREPPDSLPTPGQD